MSPEQHAALWGQRTYYRTPNLVNGGRKIEYDLHQFARDGVTLLGRIANAADHTITLAPDLKAAGITTIIWAMGYSFDFSLVRLPTFDADGFPVQQRGVTSYAGLYFVGMPWMPGQKTGLLLGVGEAAEHIAAHIAAR